MGNTGSSANNSHADLYDQYINEQKRIIAAQQEQINNLAKLNLQQNSVQQNNDIPANIFLQNMNTNTENMRKPINTYINDARQQPLPQIEYNGGGGGGGSEVTKQKLNPYKILGITKKYDEKSLKKAYLKKALVTHPDRGGTQIEFQKVSIAYTLLLKKLSDTNNNHLHNDLRNNSKSYMTTQSSDNNRNINMVDNFDANLFNKIYEENKIDDAYDRGYGEWMNDNDNAIEQPKMFNKSFNKDLFNHEFEKYKQSQQKQMGNQVMKYDEPQVDISMRGKDSLMLLGQNDVSDFSGTSEGGLAFRDYKDAFTNSCFIDTGTIDMGARDNNMKSMEQSRSNISYMMSDQDLRKQELIKLRMEKEEQERIHRINQSDSRAFNVYEQIHSRLIHK